MDKPLWTPSPESIKKAHAVHFIDRINQNYGLSLSDFNDLYTWSIAHRDDFWKECWDYTGIIGDPGKMTSKQGKKGLEDTRFFPQGSLNFAENLLRRRDGGVALIGWNEESDQGRVITFNELFTRVATFAKALKAAGLKPGDRVAAVVPNIPESIIAMLAVTSLGAIWAACSPDFGVSGILDRFAQIEPSFFVCVAGYNYNGKYYPIFERIIDVQKSMPSVKHCIFFDYMMRDHDVASGPSSFITYKDFIKDHHTEQMDFERFPFNHPLYIMFSSGTTGVPKCIIHGAGGTLIQHLKEHQLHMDIHSDDRVFYFTTCSWMMWHWLVSSLASGAAAVLYDGSPFAMRGKILFHMAKSLGVTLFGVSAKYIDAVAKMGLRPIDSHDLQSVRMIASTGSPLAPESFDYVYQSMKNDVCLASISGGTDIISCFALGNAIGPVWRGELQTRGLGMDVQVWDDKGHPVEGQKGELVCTNAFPSMPLGFWGDQDGSRYHKAYFAKYKNIWHHGDYVELTSHGGLIIHGRSDAVLNPGGIRIGTAEIYRQVEQIDDVLECFAIGQEWDHDIRIVLFVKLRDGQTLDTDLAQRIKHQIRTNTTIHHVPAKIIQVPDIPKTKSGKIVEIAVRDVVHGHEVKNKNALANPESLDFYMNIKDLNN